MVCRDVIEVKVKFPNKVSSQKVGTRIVIIRFNHQIDSLFIDTVNLQSVGITKWKTYKFTLIKGENVENSFGAFLGQTNASQLFCHLFPLFPMKLAT